MTVLPSGPCVAVELALTWSDFDGTCGSAGPEALEAGAIETTLVGFSGAAVASASCVGECSTKATTALGQEVGWLEIEPASCVAGRAWATLKRVPSGRAASRPSRSSADELPKQLRIVGVAQRDGKQLGAGLQPTVRLLETLHQGIGELRSSRAPGRVAGSIGEVEEARAKSRVILGRALDGRMALEYLVFQVAYLGVVGQRPDPRRRLGRGGGEVGGVERLAGARHSADLPARSSR